MNKVETEVRKLEHYKQFKPILEKILKGEYDESNVYYVAGTLAIDKQSIINPDEKFSYFNVRDINKCKYPIEQDVQYLTSLIYAKKKGVGFSCYQDAIRNIDIYETRLENPDKLSDTEIREYVDKKNNLIKELNTVLKRLEKERVDILVDYSIRDAVNAHIALDLK